ncbi:hypothetical protein [Pseudomonas silensiensis]|uniref:hypothetical protein n=1 Tax=Pseudomonas silensiensis TaxID=2991049 RepID=UPI003D21F8E9
MGNTYLNEAELHLQQERRSALEAVDCSIEQKNKHISGIRDYKHIEYGMNAFCSGQLIPDTTLSFSSACAGANPSLN